MNFYKHSGSGTFKLIGDETKSEGLKAIKWSEIEREKERMNELRFADGTPVRVVGELPIGEWIPVTSNGPRAKWDAVHTDVYLNETSGSFTSDDLTSLIDKVNEHYSTSPEMYFYINKHMYWQLQYAAQGKRYPSPRRCKSKARMSKKWRYRA